MDIINCKNIYYANTMQLYYAAVWVDEMYIDNTLNTLLIICSHMQAPPQLLLHEL